jgi:hypothetical protein
MLIFIGHTAPAYEVAKKPEFTAKFEVSHFE